MKPNDTESAAHRLQSLSTSHEKTVYKAGESAPSAAQDPEDPKDPKDPKDPSVYEETHVHSVYESIADHFSATRYSPWPLVARFLEAQPAGAVGLDVGCGNGKYLSGAAGDPDAAPDLFMLGCDKSSGLARLARAKHAQHRRGADVLLADSLALPFRDRCADFAICIAVVHHLSTRARRQDAVRELLRCVRPRQGAAAAPSPLSSGSVLVYVWALEQASSRRGWAAGGDQDLLVPWVKTMKEPKSHKATGESKRKQRKQKQKQAGEEEQQQPPKQEEPFVPPTFYRYYHLYREGELEEDVAAAGGRVVASGYERDNWWVVADVECIQ